MFAQQGESCLVVIEACIAPAALVVAFLAGLPEASLMQIIACMAVTTETGDRLVPIEQVFELVALLCMTHIARKARMRTMQRKPGCRMVK